MGELQGPTAGLHEQGYATLRKAGKATQPHTKATQTPRKISFLTNPHTTLQQGITRIGLRVSCWAFKASPASIVVLQDVEEAARRLPKFNRPCWKEGYLAQVLLGIIVHNTRYT